MTVEQYLLVRRLGLDYGVGFQRRHVTAGSRGDGWEEMVQTTSGLTNFSEKKLLERSKRLAWRDGMPLVAANSATAPGVLEESCM